MKDQPKVQYELRQGSRNYVRLWQGKHCLCAICTNTERGKLGAQFLLELCTNHENAKSVIAGGQND